MAVVAAVAERYYYNSSGIIIFIYTAATILYLIRLTFPAYPYKYIVIISREWEEVNKNGIRVHIAKIMTSYPSLRRLPILVQPRISVRCICSIHNNFICIIFRACALLNINNTSTTPCGKIARYICVKN